MKVKNILSGILSVGAVCGLTVACSGEKANPKTSDKSDLNPPGLLDTVTRDSKIELRWTAGNVEEDFKGYYVFALKKSAYLAVKDKALFPAKADPEKAGIPRCVDNTKWFEAFGLPATDAKCSGEDATSASGTKLTDEGTTLADTTSGEKTEKLTGFIVCDETTVKEPSLVPKTLPALSTQKCTVSKLASGEALKNGETYVFFVVAVAEDDLSKVSWTSNLVTDTPSKDSAVDSVVKLEKNQSLAITLKPSDGTATLDAAATSCISGGCNEISLPNTATPASPTIYLSRTKFTSFPQRLFISTPQTGSVKLQPRGPQTYDPSATTKVTRIPGDQAADSASFPDAGTKYIVYNNQVFDFAVTESSKTYYGKVVIGDVSYADKEDNTSTASLTVSVIMQPQAGVRDYLVSPEND